MLYLIKFNRRYNNIKNKGFKTIFCNRPDSEEAIKSQLKVFKIKLDKDGLNFIHQPVIGGQITQQDVDLFKDHYASAEKPIFAYCRSGTRSSMLWALSESSVKIN